MRKEGGEGEGGLVQCTMCMEENFSFGGNTFLDNARNSLWWKTLFKRISIVLKVRKRCKFPQKYMKYTCNSILNKTLQKEMKVLLSEIIFQRRILDNDNDKRKKGQLLMMSHCHPSNCRLAAEQKTLIRPQSMFWWMEKKRGSCERRKNPNLMTRNFLAGKSNQTRISWFQVFQIIKIFNQVFKHVFFFYFYFFVWSFWYICFGLQVNRCLVWRNLKGKCEKVERVLGVCEAIELPQTMEGWEGLGPWLEM